jgi:hypothetical protein
MTNLKRAAASLLLALFLTVPALAGDIEIPGYTAPPPQPPTSPAVSVSLLIIAHELFLLT